MPKYFYSIAAILFFSLSFGQNLVTIKGKVIDESTKLPIESATVYLTSVKDSSVVDYTITDKFGKFNFKIKKLIKPIYLKISYVSYEEFKVDLKEISADRDFETIALKIAITNLDEVLIKKEIPPIRIKKDTLEFNASSFKVRPDANVETLLKQLPGVEIDAEGKITVNGKEVNQILVNGKPFFDKDGKIALQNLPSDIINKVQITDTKTKKEEKTGAVATSDNASINLTIDEKKNKGFFGKIMGGFGTDNRYETSGLANYFKNKTKISALASSNNINSTGFSMDEIFDNMGGGRSRSMWVNGDGSFGINGRRFGGNSGITRSNMVGINYSDEWHKDLETTGSYFFSNTNSENVNRTNQTNFLPSGNFTTNSNSKTNDERFGNNLNFELEYKMDSLTSIIIEPKYSKATGKFNSNSSQTSKDNLDQLLNESTSDVMSDSDSNNFENTLTFTKSFRKKGRYFSFTFQNENNKSIDDNITNSNTIFYQGSDPNDTRNQQSKNNSIKDSYSTDFEYSEPITDSLSIKISSNFYRENLIDRVKTLDFDGVSQTYSIENDLLSMATTSRTKSLTPKAGIEWNKKNFNFNINMGTYIVNFDNNADYLNTLTTFNKDYILPDINSSFNYRFTKTKNVWLSYNYNVDLPSATQVLPVEDLSNPLNTIIGNPNIDVNKYHNLYLSFRDYDYATRSGYGIYTGGNFYDSQIVSSTIFDADRKRTTTYQNVSGTSNYWFGIYWNKSIKKEKNNYKFGINLNNSLNASKGFTDGELFTANSYNFSPRVNFTYENGELFTINPTYNYNFNKTRYSNYVVNSASNFSHKFNIQITNYWPKNWVFGNDFGYTYNSNIADGFKKDFYLWNTSLSYSFFNKKLMAKVKVYDVLNQNLSSTRTISATSIRDEENIVLKRYAMFSLTYKIEKFGAKEKKPSGRFMW
ncbi:outer membrane beta-barrel protein [Flavobacterium sp.]|uniref:outer membrane beta-barrel protein n=1 Tax=Flavobacterium sp. TaxID=239 RepID=UPI003752212D